MQQSKLTEPWEENKGLKTIRRAATELKLPLWRDNLDEYIGRFAAESWSIQHLMAVMMQDQLEMRAENRRRTLVKRADFPSSNIRATCWWTNSLGTPARPCHCCGHWILSAKAAMWSLYGNPGTPARPIWPRLWESRPVPTE